MISKVLAVYKKIMVYIHEIYTVSHKLNLMNFQILIEIYLHMTSCCSGSISHTEGLKDKWQIGLTGHH